MTAEQLSAMFTEARKEWREQHEGESQEWKHGTCTGCLKPNVQLAQHWNDVGGAGSLSCEMCWVESIMCFWASEDEA